MLDMAGVRPGSRVLDVAAGAGDQTLQAAERVGTRGQILATDISSTILRHAAANAQKAGFTNVRTQVADAEALDVDPGSFDAVISRVGLMFFPDRPRAMKCMVRALRPGGRVAAMVYSTPERNPFFSTPVAIIRRRAGLPPPSPEQPGPFCLGGDGVLESLFTGAGLADVRVERMDAPVRVGSAAECLRFERESFGALHQMMAGLDEPGRQAAWLEIERELERFEGPDGFVGPCEVLIAVGTKPPAS
jgi:SAM-dependent methyltransferase